MVEHVGEANKQIIDPISFAPKSAALEAVWTR